MSLWTSRCFARSNCPTQRRGEPYSATATFNLPLQWWTLDRAGSHVADSNNFLRDGSAVWPGVFAKQSRWRLSAGQRGILRLLSGLRHTVSGSFFVDINVTVLVSAFGFQQTVEESFSLPLVVEPGEGGGEPSSFSLSASQGCAPLTVQGENLILDAGATYAWDFGNGQTSSGLNPTFTYDAPGTYTVSLVTEVTELGPYAGQHHQPWGRLGTRHRRLLWRP